MDEQDNDDLITIMGVTAPRSKFRKALQRELDKLEEKEKEKEKEVDN